MKRAPAGASVEIDTADRSDDRAADSAARCRHASVCGGCRWQHLAYPEQGRRKQQLVQTLLRERLGVETPRVRPIVIADTTDGAPWGFRQKVHFVFAPDRGRDGLALGHFAPGGQQVVKVVECPVHDAHGNELAWRVRDACQRAGLTAARPDGRGGLLRHVVVRTSRATGESLVTLVVTDARDARLQRVARSLGEGTPAPAGIHVNELQGPSSWLFGPRTHRISGQDALREEVAGCSFWIAPTAFFQTNIAAAELLVRVVLDAVPRHVPDVLDLYAGVGLFALPLAKRGHRVTAVEEHRGAVAAGQRSCRLNRLDARRCHFICAKVERAMPSAGAKQPRAVILDPPRAGCSPDVIRRLVNDVRPEVIVYVSCEPTMLARDLESLLSVSRRTRQPYHLEAVQPVDMFPHTPHVETVAVLTNARSRQFSA